MRLKLRYTCIFTILRAERRWHGRDPVSRLSNQFLDRLGVVVYQVLGAAGEVGEGDLGGVDPEVVVEGGEDFAELNGSGVAFAGLAIGGADDLAGLHAAAGKQGAGDTGPVVAGAILVDGARGCGLSPD